MMMIPVHAVWTLLGIWLAVCVCTFMLGWYASAYKSGEAEAEERRRAVRRHPSTRYQPDRLPRPGRLPLETHLITEVVRQPDPAQWWPALERHARADTAPLSAVELSNWEANIRRKTDAWLHERGMQ